MDSKPPGNPSITPEGQFFSMLDRDRIQTGRAIGHSVQVFRSTHSTNDLVLCLGEGGAKEGIVVFAEEQTGGRGQHGRKWSSAPGLGLWFSVLLRPQIPLAEMPILTRWAASALARCLFRLGLHPGIKLPNDVYCGTKKIAGILLETRTGSRPFAVLGVGINVLHRLEDFPEELRASATSIAGELGTSVDRDVFARDFLEEFGDLYALRGNAIEKAEDEFGKLVLPERGVAI